MSNEFGNKLRILREEMKLTQQDLGNFMNVHKVTISKWERGLTEPSIEDIIKLSKKLNISTDELFNNKECKNQLKKSEINIIYDQLNRPSKNLLIGFGKKLLEAEGKSPDNNKEVNTSISVIDNSDF